MTSGRAAPEISILIISFNTKEMTLDCLRTVYAQTDPDLIEVILVDNDSHDGSADAIAAQFPQVNLIRSKTNTGFAAANNLAARQARGRYLFLLNSDTLVLDRGIEKLLAFAKANPGARIWGPRNRFADGTLNPYNCHGQMTLWSLFARASGLARIFKQTELFNPEGYGGWARDRVRAVDIVTGCSLLITHDEWIAREGFDPTFFMYGEEADLCLRVKAAGGQPMVTPDAEIVHYGGASDTVAADRLVKIMAGKMTLIRQHFNGVSRTVAQLLHKLYPFSRMLANAVRKRIGGSDDPAWAEIWARRAEWQNGFPKVERPRVRHADLRV